MESSSLAAVSASLGTHVQPTRCTPQDRGAMDAAVDGSRHYPLSAVRPPATAENTCAYRRRRLDATCPLALAVQGRERRQPEGCRLLPCLCRWAQAGSQAICVRRSSVGGLKASPDASSLALGPSRDLIARSEGSEKGIKRPRRHYRLPSHHRLNPHKYGPGHQATRLRPTRLIRHATDPVSL
jgi:hypothetical protein